MPERGARARAALCHILPLAFAAVGATPRLSVNRPDLAPAQSQRAPHRCSSPAPCDTLQGFSTLSTPPYFPTAASLTRAALAPLTQVFHSYPPLLRASRLLFPLLIPPHPLSAFFVSFYCPPKVNRRPCLRSLPAHPFPASDRCEPRTQRSPRPLNRCYLSSPHELTRATGFSTFCLLRPRPVATLPPPLRNASGSGEASLCVA